MSLDASLAAAEVGWLWQEPVGACGHVRISGDLAPDAGKAGQKEEESRGVSQELSKGTGAREAVFPGICV